VSFDVVFLVSFRICGAKMKTRFTTVDLCAVITELRER